MAESFAFRLANQVLGKLGLLALQEVVLVWGVKDDLEDLKNTISTIQAVILDAEEQKSNNHQISDWLRKLKNALYDAEDVIDAIEYEVLRRKVAKSGSTGKQVRSLISKSNPLAFRFKMGHKMKNLRERFDKIAADHSKFNLTERAIVVESNMVNRKREMTHSYVDVSNIIGRDLEKENILSMLMQPSNDEQENVSVIPIIGIGGMGKTALAKLVFNDERVIERFDKRMWVCVSDEDFETEKLTKKILVSATKESAPDLPLDESQTQLRNELDNRRYLLVLDDVWNDDREKWLKLKELLVGGADGSKIVVTTRKKSVASVMGTLPPQELKGLSHQDCMSLFVKCAFIDGEGKHYSNLVKLGDEIVKKCGGVPLAVRALGCFLFGKVDEHVWASMRDNEIWKSKEDRILPVLKLSYDELPACLKQCFVFCSLFPKDYEFSNYELIQFWLAHGLIQPSGRNEDLEDIGNEYVTELCSRSFFQDVEDLKFMVTFKMHDLVHDLAQSVAQFDHYTPNDAKKLHSSEVHHVSCHGPEEVLTLAQNIDKIRTIMFHYKDGWATGGKSFVSTCASRFKCIRFLDLSDSDFEALPSSIGEMKHLRYLTLSRNKRIKKLPASICKLYHLQTLKLGECGELEELPCDMGNLISLRLLWVTTKQRTLPGKENGMGCLISLRFLWIDKCDNLESMFEGIQNLNALRTLIISDCPSLVSLSTSVKHLTALENLIIYDCERLDLMDGGGDEENGIQGSSSSSGSSSRLRSFVIVNLPKLDALPHWLIHGPTATTLRYLYIASCHNFKALPKSLENLISLQEIEIKDCPTLSALPEGMHRLTALQVLAIEDCPELSRRCEPQTGEDWHCIAHLPRICLDGEDIKPTNIKLVAKILVSENRAARERIVTHRATRGRLVNHFNNKDKGILRSQLGRRFQLLRAEQGEKLGNSTNL